MLASSGVLALALSDWRGNLTAGGKRGVALEQAHLACPAFEWHTHSRPIREETHAHERVDEALVRESLALYGKVLQVELGRSPASNASTRAGADAALMCSATRERSADFGAAAGKHAYLSGSRGPI